MIFDYSTMDKELIAVLNRSAGKHASNFIAGGPTWSDVWNLAEQISGLVLPSETLCMLTQDKYHIAAAFLASVFGGPQIIIPYAFSTQAFTEAREKIHFSKMICAADIPKPADCIDILPGSATFTVPLLRSSFDPDIPRIIIFTGGTSGKPKLWSKTARNLLSEAMMLSKTFGIGPHDRILTTVPPHHIYGLLFSILVPLVSGCTVTGPIYSFPHEILAVASDLAATILVSVPTLYHMLKTERLKRNNLKLAFSSAGTLFMPDAMFFFEKTGLKVTEIYGSTETGGIAWKSTPTDRRGYHAFNGIDWKINHGRLQVRSDFLSPELPCDQHGFFTSTDQAAYCGIDSFILQGRLDNIVKVGGRRVDLSEICDKIKTLNGVSGAVVFAMQAQTGRGIDIAALIEGAVSASDIRSGLAKLCEPYAMPRHIKIVDLIPSLPTGKYDRETIENLFISPQE